MLEETKLMLLQTYSVADIMLNISKFIHLIFTVLSEARDTISMSLDMQTSLRLNISSVPCSRFFQ